MKITASFVASTALVLLSFGLRLTAQPAQEVSVYPTNSAVLPGRGPASHWGGLTKVWAERHAEWSATAANDHDGVVFVGDSITQGWKTMGDDFPGLKVVNRGISGDTTRGVLYRLDADVLSLDPRAIVLLIGTNDIGAGADPADVAYNIDTIINRIRKKYHRIPIIVCKVMPSSEKQHRPAETIEKLDHLIQADVDHKRHVYLCDTWSIFAQPDGDCSRAIFPDLLHPNAAGYEKWAAALKPIFAKLDLKTD